MLRWVTLISILDISAATRRRWVHPPVLRNGVKKKPDDASVHDHGLTFFLQEPADYNRAVTEFAAALRSDPKNEKALEFSVQTYLKLNDPANARKSLDALRAVNSSNQSLPGLTSAVDNNSQTSR